MKFLSAVVGLGLLAAACSSADTLGSTDQLASGLSDAAAEASSSTTAPSTAPTTTAESTTTTTAPSTDEAARYESRDVGEGWIEIDHVAGPGEEPCRCSDGSDWNFYAREGAAGASKVMVLFEGGGACWNELTCTPGTGAYKRRVSDDRDGYDAALLSGIGGVFDRSNPANPLADYTVVFVPYCTGDVHLGNAEVTYGDDLVIQHRGAVNARAAMDWVVDSYGAAEDLFVTGMSAGSIPAPLFAGLLADELPGARVVSLSDASGAYPTAPEISALMDANGAVDETPDWDEYSGTTSADLGIPGITWRTGLHNPDIVLARYDNAYDEVQALFRTFLGIPADDLAAEIVRIDAEIEANGRPVASYVAPGTDHTILMSDRLYTETVEGVAFVDWLTDLVEGDPVVDVVCTECGGG